MNGIVIVAFSVLATIAMLGEKPLVAIVALLWAVLLQLQRMEKK